MYLNRHIKFFYPIMSEKAMILLAEPEEAIRESIEMVLLDEGYDCHAVSDTEALLRAIHIHDSDLIIADVHLIHQEARKILETLDEYANPPTIMVNLNYERIRDMLDLIKFGIGEYLLTPFQFEEMLDRVHRLLSERTNSNDRR